MVLTMPVVVKDSEEVSLQAQDAASHTWLMDSEEDSQLYGFSCCMDESSRDRMAEATVFLQPLNSILEGADSNLSLEPLPTQGDGYCFFYVAAGVCSMEVSQTAARQVFACALEASCSEVDAKNAFGGTPEERTQRVAMPAVCLGVIMACYSDLPDSLARSRFCMVVFQICS